MLHKVNFSELVLALAESGYVHLGIIPNPATGKAEANLDVAQHTIETLAILEEKTKNNLTKEEGEILSKILYELRMTYVTAVQSNPAAESGKNSSCGR